MNDPKDLTYRWGAFEFGGGIFIESVSMSEGPWAILSINLIDYGLMPEENHIFLPVYKMPDPIFYQEFMDKYVIESKPFTFGPWGCECLDCTLKPDWKDSMEKNIYF